VVPASDGERIIEGVDDRWVLGGILNLTLPISGRLGVEREKAQSEAGTAVLRALAEERRVLAELRAAWAEWSAANERAALTRQLVAELDPVVERTERLRAAGELDPVDARLLRIEQVSQTAKLRAYEVNARAAEVELKARLGLLSTADVKLTPSVLIPEVYLTADSQLPSVIAEHPLVRLARAEYEVAERTFKLEVRKQYPDLKIGGGFGTDEGDERVLFGAALPLPLFNANRRAIAEARASREVARARAEIEYERLLAEASVAQVRLRAARGRLVYVEKELAPLADQQVADARRLAQLGDFNTLVLLEALKTAHEAKLEVLDTRLNLTLDSRRLEALLEGGSLTADQAPEETK
jgi:outer membrane protein TolC